MSGTWVANWRNSSNTGYVNATPTAGNALVVSSRTTIGGGDAHVVSFQAMSATNGGGSVLATFTIPTALATVNSSTTAWNTGGYLLNVPAGVNSILVNFTSGGTPGSCSVQAVEISGLFSYLTSIRNYQVTPGTTTDAITSTTTSVSSIPAYILGVTTNDGSGDTVAGTNFILRGTVDGNWAVEDRRETGSTGSYATTFTAPTHGGGDNYTATLIAFLEPPLGYHIVQGKTNTLSSAGSSVTTTPTSTITSGNAVMATVHYGDLLLGVATAVSNFKDQSNNILNAYEIGTGTYNSALSLGTHLFFLPNLGSGITAITVNMANSVSLGITLAIEEVSGLGPTAASIVGYNSSNTTSTLATNNINTGSAIPTAVPVMVYAVSSNDTRSVHSPTAGTSPIAFGAGLHFAHPTNTSTSLDGITENAEYTSQTSVYANFTNTGLSGDVTPAIMALIAEASATLAFSPGIFTLTGQSAGLSFSSGAYTALANTGSFALTGPAATLTPQINYNLVAASGAFDLVGGIATSAVQIDVSAGIYSLVGPPASFIFNTNVSYSINPFTGYYFYNNAFIGVPGGTVVITASEQFTLNLQAGFYTQTGLSISGALISSTCDTGAPQPGLVLNLEIVSDAFQKIGIIDETQAPSAEQGANGLRLLNDYLLNQAADGMRLGWFKQTNLMALAPLRQEDVWGVKLLLARQLATAYGITIQDPMLAMDIETAEKQLTKRSILYFQSDLGELQRQQAGPFLSGPGWF